jgi:hypothetical protein
MAHLDNPEKHQYNPSEIIGHCGADVAYHLKPTSSGRYQLIGEMITHVCENNITEFCDLMFHAQTERFNDWFPLLCDNSAYILGQVIKSIRNKTVLQCENGGETRV